MRKIYKYVLPDSTPSIVKAPSGAMALCAQVQADKICVWMNVDPGAEDREYDFHIVPTGGEVPEYSHYVSTVQILGGKFIFHIYLED